MDEKYSSAGVIGICQYLAKNFHLKEIDLMVSLIIFLSIMLQANK